MISTMHTHSFLSLGEYLFSQAISGGFYIPIIRRQFMSDHRPIVDDSNLYSRWLLVARSFE